MLSKYLPLKKWSDLNSYTYQEFSGMSNHKVEEKLFYTFVKYFNLQDLSSFNPTPRLSIWYKIFQNPLHNDFFTYKLERCKRSHYMIDCCDLPTFFYYLCNDYYRSLLTDHSRMFLTNKNEPIIISTVYCPKNEIETFLSQCKLKPFVVSILDGMSWRLISKNTCLIIFNTAPNLQDYISQYKKEALKLLTK